MIASFIFLPVAPVQQKNGVANFQAYCVRVAIGPSVVVFWAPGAFVAGRLDDDELYALFLDLCRGQLGPRRGESLPLRPNHL